MVSMAYLVLTISFCVTNITRNSAIADKLRDAFEVSQGHQAGYHSSDRYNLLLVCYRNFLRKIFDFKTFFDLKTGLRVRESH